MWDSLFLLHWFSFIYWVLIYDCLTIFGFLLFLVQVKMSSRHEGRTASSEIFENQSDCEDESKVCSKAMKGKKLWKRVRCQLVEYHSLPGYLRDNEYILGHYRSEWPLKQVILSIFTIHNETLNVWT